MNDTNNLAIRVANLSKMFKVYSRPADMFWEIVTGKPRYRPFWALRDISFEVRRGQVVGIIGRNGAGKSTLLKIITGTLDKTAGDVQVTGRISSILELGTGFSPEITGRENVIMGGLMVGMTREEILAKMNWIIEFSELEDFIDQPFKTYSTGMQARLTFATATCIDPDILIIDEALSVGDARFQRKSFGKIEEFRKEGRTILLVSHDINTISSFCDHVIFLEKGQIFDQGEPQRIGKVYYQRLFASDERIVSINSTVEQGGAENLTTIEIPLMPPLIKHDLGYAWKVDLSHHDIFGDTLENPKGSSFILFENDSPVGPSHAIHDQIRTVGKGAFSHWSTQLYFSTSDNSDPRKNRRNYLLSNKPRLSNYVLPSHLNQQNDERSRLREWALNKLGLDAPCIQDNSQKMRMGNRKAEILDYGILDEQGNKVTLLKSGNKYTLFFKALYYENVDAANVGFLIRSVKGIDLFGATTTSFNYLPPARKRGELIDAKLHVTMWLTNGIYFLTVNTAHPYADNNVQYDSLFDGYQFEVERAKNIFNTSVVNLNPSLEVNVLGDVNG